MANKKSDYFVYTHHDPTIVTMGDFVADQQSLGLGFDISALLNYEDENTVKNLDNLLQHYTQDELTKYKSLIDQVRQKGAKQQQKQTSTISSSQGGGSTPVTVTTIQKPPPTIILKPGFSVTLLQALVPDPTLVDAAGKPLVLNANQQTFVSLLGNRFDDQKLGDQVRQLFTKFCLQVRKHTFYEVRITSSFRNTSKEASNFNWHKAGLAIDINLVAQRAFTKNLVAQNLPLSLTQPTETDVDGNFTGTDVGRSSITSEWLATGVVGIGNVLNIRWGGSFGLTSNDGLKQFDPIHFDLAQYFTVDQQAFQDAINGPVGEGPNTENLPTDNSGQVLTSTVNQPYLSLPLHVGTILNMPLADIDRDLLVTETNQAVDQTTYNNFLARELYFLLRDPGYDREFIPKKTTLGEIREIFPFMSVWVWSRSLSIDPKSSAKNKIYNHQIINVTPYVSALNTSVGHNGGSFSIELSALTAEIVNNTWQVEEGTRKSSKASDEGDYVAQSFMHYEQDGELKRSRFFFDKAFQANDVVFIRFERLKLEDQRQNLDSVAFIPVDQLPNQIFDMIGLIDAPTVSTNYASASASVSVQGRDLVKLLIEDGVYFYPAEFTADGIFANETGATNFRLNRFNGQILTRFQQLNRTIDRSLKYVMNALSSIEICPTDLFDAYRNSIDRATGSGPFDKRSKAYQLDDAAKNQIQDNNRSLNDKQDKIITDIDHIRQNNNIVDGTSGSTYFLIKQFLQDQVQQKTIQENASQNIQSWTVTINSVAVDDQLPPDLKDQLFLRDRVWVDNQGRLATDPDSLSVVSSMNDLYTRLSGDPRIVGLKINNLARFDQDFVPTDVQEESYTLDDILSELQVALNKSTFVDGVEYSGTGQQAVVVNTVKYPITVDQTITDIQSRYTTVLSIKGKKAIQLVVIEKRISDVDLDGSVLKVFNDTYSLVKQENSLKTQQAPIPSLLPVHGIWQIIKLVIDDSVRNRLLVDPSIGNEHGSLINAIRKICQEPFVEFFTDTYGDQFYFIVRKPPFDYNSILSALENRTVFETFQVGTQQPVVGVLESGATKPPPTGTSSIELDTSLLDIVLTINEADVISDSLTFSQEAYSWYRLQMQNLISGSDADMAFAYLKAVYFSEYADQFGSKPLDVSTSYIPFQNIVGKNQQQSTAYFIQQAVQDLRFMIESHAHIPFTRQGTITMNGDRRFKRGTFVRYAATDEIFYVDNVAQSGSISDGSIDRQTTLTVSKGMVEKYIRGVNIGKSDIPVSENFNANVISYFNICYLPIDKAAFDPSKKSDVNRVILKKWRVNPMVFNFFVKKLQFDKNSEEIPFTYNHTH